jgi:DNA-binding IclR family transcriptional regulator
MQTIASARSAEVDWSDDTATSVLGRAASILDAFDCPQTELSLSELIARSGLPKSTVHRFSRQLQELGWIERSPGGYRVGLRLFELGGLAGNRNRLLECALPTLTALAAQTKVAVHLAVLDHNQVLYLEKLPARGFTLPTRRGGRMPVHCTSLGKAILAFATDDQITDVLASGMERRTSSTIAESAQLLHELREIREAGVAFDRDEACVGVSCVAAPIRGSGRAIAAVSLCGRSGVFDAEAHATVVKRAARAIWVERFGGGSQRN